MILKALSIQQPWAWAILHGKPVENRSWFTNFRGEFFIHAGKKIDKDAYEFIEKLLNVKIPADLPTGGIVGKSEIYDCVQSFDSEWFFGEHGFLLRNTIEMPHFPVKGQLGFFDVDYPDELLNSIVTKVTYKFPNGERV